MPASLESSTAASRAPAVMSNVLLINAHEPYPFSPGELNRSLVERAAARLEAGGHQVRTTTMQDEWEADAEIEKHRWADIVVIQSPVNWMGMPWSFKRYMDLVYTAGMDGRLCAGDGRSRETPDAQYGSAGTLDGAYLLSVTFNAPRDAFDDPAQEFFAGKGVDDLLWPMHLNLKFFGLRPLPTFACYDVLKAPTIEQDFERFDAHLDAHIPAVREDAPAR